METTGIIGGLHRDCRVYYWGYMGIMEKKMETTTMGYIGVCGVYRVYIGIMEREGLYSGPWGVGRS